MLRPLKSAASGCLLSWTLALACLCSWTAIGQTPPPSPASSPGTAQPSAPSATDAQSWSWFSEAGASTKDSLLGGLGIAMDLAAGQQIFAEAALQTGEKISQSSTLLIGVKSNYPAITFNQRKYQPFSIVGYGASITSLLKDKTISPPASLGLNAATVTSIGTSAGFAQQYAGGIQTVIGSWNVGLGISGDKTTSGWKAYPFVFVSREFGKP
jgi:hypothetical protein